jgi:hypothetical protein
MKTDRDVVPGLVIIPLLLCAESTLAETADECRKRAEESPQVRLLEDDGNSVTVHVLDPDRPDQWQVLSDAENAGDAIGMLGSCGDTALQIYIVSRRPLTGSVEQNERPSAPPVPPVSVPPSNLPPPGGAVDLACRGTYTECYGRPRPPLPGYTSGEPDGGKNITRIPGSIGGGTPGGAESPHRPTLDAAIDDCLKPHFTHHTSPDWSRFDTTFPQAGQTARLQVAFPIVQHAVIHTLEIEKRVYGKLPYGDNSYAYMEGWLGRCLWDAGALSKQEDPRAPYARFLKSQNLTKDELDERYYDWDVGFTHTWSPWPWAVYRDRKLGRPQ